MRQPESHFSVFRYQDLHAVGQHWGTSRIRQSSGKCDRKLRQTVLTVHMAPMPNILMRQSKSLSRRPLARSLGRNGTLLTQYARRSTRAYVYPNAGPRSQRPNIDPPFTVPPQTTNPTCLKSMHAQDGVP